MVWKKRIAGNVLIPVLIPFCKCSRHGQDARGTRITLRIGGEGEDQIRGAVDVEGLAGLPGVGAGEFKLM